MNWTRRRSAWPLFTALAVLCFATMAAPWAVPWIRAARRQTGGGPTSLSITPEPTTSVVSEAPAPRRVVQAQAPTLGDVAPRDLRIPPPSAASAEAARRSAETPALADDDYLAIDEPLVEPAAPQPSEAANSPHAAAEPPQDAAQMLASARRQFDVVRERLAPPLGRAIQEILIPAPAEPTPALPLPARPPVRVDSDRDRLAMATPKERAVETPRWNRPAVAPPTALLTQMDRLAELEPTAPWIAAVRGELERIGDPAVDYADAARSVAALRQLAAQGLEEAVRQGDAAMQSAWLRTGRALERRLELWQTMSDASAVAAADRTEQSPHLAEILGQLEQLTAGSEAGQSWRAYLRLADVAGLASVGGEPLGEARRELARDVLGRMHHPSLSTEQHEFLSTQPVADLALALEPWASGPLSLSALDAAIERYESQGALADADGIAAARRRLAWTDSPQLMRLAEDLNRNYRNANVRVAFSRELLKRLIPQRGAVSERVHEKIAGTEVRGRSQTQTDVQLRMLPSNEAWRFELSAEGDVRSRTSSNTWPAKVRNASRMRYHATKEIVVDGQGLQIAPAQATASGRTDLVGVDSSFESVPLLGSLVESAARRRHRESRSTALSQVKAKVARQARQRMDREADAKLHGMEQRVRLAVTGPLERLAVSAEPLEMNTSEDRAVMRLRLADEAQLAAHTPRPSAPSDSVLSLQFHESALNNAVGGLGLDGRRITVGELHKLLTEKIERRPAEAPADLPQKAIVQFAPRDAVRFVCRDDRVELVLRIVEMRKGRDSIRNVGVHAIYRPELAGMEVKLVREGGLQFDGAHLRTGPRMVLHSVFGKLLRKDQEVPVLAARVSDDPRLAGLMVTQLVIEDGWVAIAAGPASPHRTAWRTRGASTSLAR